MTSSEGEWASGKGRRFDQIFYDWAGIEQKLKANPSVRTWVKHVYNRDRTVDEAGHKIVKHVMINYTSAYILEKKVPAIATWRSYWPLFCAYTYVKNAASFNTVFLTGLDSGARGYVRANSRYWEAVEKGEYPPGD